MTGTCADMGPRYLVQLVASTVLLLAGVCALNLIIDPAGLYGLRKNSPEHYARVLAKSEYGLWWPADSFDERAIKAGLLRFGPPADCIVIGSSHAMQIGSAVLPPSLRADCGSLLNAAVSGAGLEDHLALAAITRRSRTPRHIVFGIAPWTFAFGKDVRWTRYADDYAEARRLTQGKETTASPQLDAIRNLVSLEYTQRSIKAALKRSPGQQAIMPAGPPAIDPEMGGQHAVLRSDGSLVYSADYIARASQAAIPPGGSAYKTEGALNEPEAIALYRSMLEWLMREGIKPVLLLTPYHPTVWDDANSANRRAMLQTEAIVRDIARSLSLQVIGSYDPLLTGCTSSEFFDFMHARAKCLDRLEVLPATAGVAQ